MRLFFVIVSVILLAIIVVLNLPENKSTHIENKSNQDGIIALSTLKENCGNIEKYKDHIRKIEIYDKQSYSIIPAYWDIAFKVKLILRPDISKILGIPTDKPQEISYYVGRGAKYAGIAITELAAAHLCEWPAPQDDNARIIPITNNFPASFAATEEQLFERAQDRLCSWKYQISRLDYDAEITMFNDPAQTWKIGDKIKIESDRVSALLKGVSTDKTKTDLIEIEVPLAKNSTITIIDKHSSNNSSQKPVLTFAIYTIQSPQHPGKELKLPSWNLDWYNTKKRVEAHISLKEKWKEERISKLEQEIFIDSGLQREEILLRVDQEKWTFGRRKCYSRY